MSEALARVRSDSVLSRPAPRSRPGPGVAAAIVRRLLSLPKRVYVFAAVVALLAAIGVNALVLQRGRHPAPLFAKPAAPSAAPSVVAPVPSPAAPEPAREASAPPAASVVEPPVRATPADSSAARDNDPIGALLRGEGQPDDGRLVLAAQNALIKLGYPVKADGAMGAATKQAIRDFEHAHGLPPNDLTPRLIKQLNAAAARTTMH